MHKGSSCAQPICIKLSATSFKCKPGLSLNKNSEFYKIIKQL